MLGRALLLTSAACIVVAACSGDDFAADNDASGGGQANAGEGSGAGGSGAAPSAAGSLAMGGVVAHGGTPGEGGAGGSGGTPSPPPSIEIVQTSRTSVVGNSDPSLTLAATPAAGNALLVGVTCFSDVDNCIIPPGGVTDNQGNQYALVLEGPSIVSSDTHGSRGYLFIAENIPTPTGPVTITVNPNGTPPENVQNFAWGVLEVSGLADDSVDQTGTFPNSCCFTSTTVETDGSTAQPNELAVAVHTARSNDNDFNYGHEPTWTERHVNNDGLSLASQHSLVTRVLSETGVVRHTWTHDETSRGASAIIATFRGATE